MAKTLLSAHSGLSAHELDWEEALKQASAAAPTAPTRGLGDPDHELGAPCANKVMAPESPRTPRQMSTPRSFTPPTAPRSFTPRTMVQWHRLPKPMLMKALENKSAADVQAILQQSPETANEPFWDHECEPPICCAVRLSCPASIVQLLLEHGASIEDTNVRGRTPAQILSEAQQQPCEAPLPWEAPLAWEMNTVGGPAQMASFLSSSHVHAAPFHIEKMLPTMASFGSYPFVDAAPDVKDLETIREELEKLLNA